MYGTVFVVAVLTPWEGVGGGMFCVLLLLEEKGKALTTLHCTASEIFED